MPLATLMFNLCILCRQDFCKTIVCSDCWDLLDIQPHYTIRQEIKIQSMGQYKFPLNKIIQKLKSQNGLHYLPVFEAILDLVPHPKVQAIVPMPISTQKLQKRGYNQAHLLAKIISKKYNIPIWNPIIRRKSTAQKDLSRAERLAEINQQFSLCPQNKIKYRKVLIIDDIVTTGASIRALHQQLLQLGSQEISVLCIANVFSVLKTG